MTIIYQHKNNKQGQWQSDLNILEPSICIENQVENILSVAQKKAGHNECSVMFKGDWGDDGFVVSNEYYIPKQEVSSTSVDYKEDISKLRRENGFNVICHSHPFSRNSNYSNSDEEHVNSHFPCSLLANDIGEIIMASLKLDTPNPNYKIKVKIKGEDIKYYSNLDVSVEGLDNIVEEEDYYYSRHSKNISVGNYKYLEQNKIPKQTSFGLGSDWKQDKGGVWRKKTKEELTEEEEIKECHTYGHLYDYL